MCCSHRVTPESKTAGPPGPAASALVDRVQPGIDVLLGFILGIAVALLQAACELRALAFDDVKVIVGQLAPFLAHLTLEGLPITLNTVPVHAPLPCCLEIPATTATWRKLFRVAARFAQLSAIFRHILDFGNTGRRSALSAAQRSDVRHARSEPL